VEQGTKTALRPWQQKLLREAAEGHGEDYSLIEEPF
jgi:hypothetical protein